MAGRPSGLQSPLGSTTKPIARNLPKFALDLVNNTLRVHAIHLVPSPRVAPLVVAAGGLEFGQEDCLLVGARGGGV